MDARTIEKVQVRFPPKLKFLFRPKRYKVIRGGRGSAKSWSVARALLIMGQSTPLRILCTREVQKSIKDSVHKLLSDQIEKLGLTNFYDIYETEIRGANGTLFIFSGLSQHTVDSIKSFEGIDICWVEEAHAVTKRSWEVLIPTIRKESCTIYAGELCCSEIWITFNPELDTDPTYIRFVVEAPDECISVLMNYLDNPWFPQVLELERQHCKLTDAQGYENIWEGKCKPAVAGAIYYEQVEAAINENRICNVPYDPMLKVHVVFDLGFNDAMSVSMVQRLRSEIRIIDYMEDTGKTLDWYSAMLKIKMLNWGKVFLPHDGFSRDHKSGKTSAEIMEALGWEVVPREAIVEIGIEEGIRVTRQMFRQMYFDKAKTERLVQCAKRYRRNINQQTQEAGSPRHDEFSHGADNLRYIAINTEEMTNGTTTTAVRRNRTRGGMAA